jgi:imidazole glycerol phosphate synthase glutamine amidotransferase subunit
MVEVVVVPTGTANIASVLAAFGRMGVVPRVSEDRAEVAGATHVMLPGVGAFGAAMARLVELGLDAVLRERVAADRPTIAICVGHQLLFETSDENPGVRGLGLAQGHIGRFPEDVRVPQFGWNAVQAGDGSSLIEGGWAYFANSYRATEAPGWRVATATHGARYVAAMERGNVIGCQFHPELSGAYGEALLARFLELR